MTGWTDEALAPLVFLVCPTASYNQPKKPKEPMAIKFLSNRLEETLAKAEYSQASTAIPNDHPVMASELEFLQDVAVQLGVDFAATNYTFTVRINDKGDVSIYGPLVANKDGVASLYWGDSVTALKDIKVDNGLTDVGKLTFYEFSLAEGDDLHFLVAPMSLKKGPNGKPVADKDALKKDAKRGKLANHLSEGFVRAGALTELEPGEYRVVGYQQGTYQGEPTYQIQLENGAWFKANTAIKRRLETKPKIDAEHPADLIVGEVVEHTSEGKPIVPVKLITASFKAAKTYSF